MFAGFNLKLTQKEIQQVNNTSDDLFELGKGLLLSHRDRVTKSLVQYCICEDNLSATKIEEDWFPEIKADIFISYSHNDYDLACALAGYLHHSCRITSFIDSAVWGYADELLKKIDNLYSKNKDGLFDYDKTRYSSRHVHMLLNGALMKMLDRTECIIFLNTPNTIKFRDENKKPFTDSPWLYSELLMTQLLRKNPLSNYRQETSREISHGGGPGFSVNYEVSTDHLIDLSFSDLKAIGNNQYSGSQQALDSLYLNKGILGSDDLYG